MALKFKEVELNLKFDLSGNRKSGHAIYKVNSDIDGIDKAGRVILKQADLDNLNSSTTIAQIFNYLKNKVETQEGIS